MWSPWWWWWKCLLEGEQERCWGDLGHKWQLFKQPMSAQLLGLRHMWWGESVECWRWWKDLLWESRGECPLVWEYLLELTESPLADRLLCCPCCSGLISTVLVLTVACCDLWVSVTPRVVSLIGLSTCLVISLRKAENFIFSFIKFFLASLFFLSCSFLSSFPSPSLGPVSASIDLALRKLFLFPEPCIILKLFFRVPWVAPRCEDWPFSRLCLAECLLP